MAAQKELLSGARSPSWEIWLLNDQDEPVRRITAVTSGDVNLSATDRLGGGANLTLGREDAETIDWQRDRCSITYNPGIAGVEPWPLGVFLFSSPTYKHGLAPSWDVELQTKMLILDQATTEGRWQLPAGRNLVESAAELIRATGETRLAVTPSEAVSSSDLIFPSGESVLTVVNKLMEAASYWGCHVDGSGQYVLAPYRSPGRRPISWSFEAGETAIHAPEWERTQDQSSVPNRVEAYTPGDDKKDPIIGVATNTDPDSPYSYQARGRWIVRREQIEAATQAEADQNAARLLTSSMNPLAKLSVSHALVPIRPREVVRFISGGVDTKAAIQKMSISVEYTAQVKAEWNEVTTSDVGSAGI